MFKLYALILAIISSGCIEVPHDQQVIYTPAPEIDMEWLTRDVFIDKHGLFFEPQGNWVFKDNLETAVDILVDELSSRFPELYPSELLGDLLRETPLIILIESESFYCSSSPTLKCLGLYKANTRVGYIKFVNEPLPKSSFVHEMIHFFRHKIEWTADHNPDFYYEDGSVEQIVNERLEKLIGDYLHDAAN